METKSNLKKKLSKKSPEKTSDLWDFLSKGLACQAICLIEYSGLLEIIKKDKFLNSDSFSKFNNPALLLSALNTLVGAGVFSFSDGKYRLTKLGKNLVKNISAISLPLFGYRNFFANQYKLLSDPSLSKRINADYASIALSSISFGENYLDPIIFELLRQIRPRGTVCDLGCGTGEKLIRICGELKVDGLGIEKDHHVMEKSKDFCRENARVEIINEDIMQLQGIWEDVDIVLMSMVFHDIVSSQDASSFLRSLKLHFPRMRCLMIVDIVSFSETNSTNMPGFDYVHGLQGFIPRTYEENLKIFSDAGFSILKETKFPNISNTYVWAIKP